MVGNLTNLPYQERLVVLGLHTLEYRRKRPDMIELYTITHNVDKVNKEKVFGRNN